MLVTALCYPKYRVVCQRVRLGSWGAGNSAVSAELCCTRTVLPAHCRLCASCESLNEVGFGCGVCSFSSAHLFTHRCTGDCALRLATHPWVCRDLLTPSASLLSDVADGRLSAAGLLPAPLAVAGCEGGTGVLQEPRRLEL